MKANDKGKPQKTNPYYALDDLGNFGSQDPALQLTADDSAAISRYIQARKQGLSHEEAQQLALGEGK